MMSLKKMTATQFSRLSVLGQIGIEPPTEAKIVQYGPHCSLKLKPTKYPKGKSKRVYKGFLLRPVGYFTHIYSIEANLYIVSIFKTQDAKDWIDRNYDEILRRIDGFKKP
jgi:hypothetical protein